MRIILKLFFLRAILGIAIFIASPMAAQRKVLKSDGVEKAEKKVVELPPGRGKVDQLLDISNIYSDQQNIEFQNLEKATKYANQAFDISENIGYQKGVGKSYLQLSRISQEAKNYLEGKAYATKAINILKKLSDPEPDLLGESWVMLWSTSTLTGASYTIRLNLLKNAKEAFRLSGNALREGDCFKELGDIYQIEGDYAHSLIVLNKAMALYEKAGFKKLQHIYDLTGRVYLQIGNLDKGVEYILMAEDVADETGDTSLFTSTLNNSIALAYIKVNEPQKALPYIQKALRVAMNYNDFDHVVVILSNNISINIRLGKTKEALLLLNKITARYPALKNQKNPKFESMMANIYIARKELDKAAFYCNGIEKKIKKYGPEINKDDIFNFLSSIIRYNIAAGHYDKATYYNDKYDSICNIRKRMYCNAYDLWEFKIDSAAGNYLSAIGHFQRFKKANDEMLSEAKTKQINQLNIFHESEKKDKNIQLLKQRAVVQESRVDSANFIRNTSLAGFLLLMIFIFFMYKNYMQKQKTNIALSAQKEEIKIKNEELQCLVTEKEWLLKEIHHRVKNNLHMVIGLLASQGEYLKSKEAAQAMGESQRRVEAMSIIHQKLYQSENLSMIDMPSYIYELTENLADSFERGRHIRFQLDIANVMFPLSHSVPVGLIVNEAVTNAIKYAFPNEGDCSIEIVLKKEENNSFFMKISDNGIGIGKDFSIEECSSLGLRLMQGLTGDIQGDFQIKDNNGTEIIVRFTIREEMASNLKLLKV